MGMFNDLMPINKSHINLHKPVYITRYTESTRDGLFRWQSEKDIRGFRAVGEQTIVLQNCALIIIVNGIKQKHGKAEISLLGNGKSLQKYSEDIKKRNNFITITYSGSFKTNDKISVNTENIKDIQLVVYGNII